jgi:hypothetical protein
LGRLTQGCAPGTASALTLGCYGECQVSKCFQFMFSFLSLEAVFVFFFLVRFLFGGSFEFLRCSSLLSAREFFGAN